MQRLNVLHYGLRRPVASAVLALFAGAAVATVGCATIDFRSTVLNIKGAPRIKTLAVTTLQNLATMPEAGQAVTEALVNELHRKKIVSVVQSAGGAGSVERWSAARLGRQLQVDAVLGGVVTAFDYGPGAQPGTTVVTPGIAIDLQLVSAENGDLLWAATVRATRDQLSSYDGISLVELTQSIAEKVVFNLTKVMTGP